MAKAIITITRHLEPDTDSTFNIPADASRKDRAADLKRRDAWRAGEWDYVGVIARATIKIPYGAASITATIDSPGLWGVENDSGEDYLAHVFGEERATLLDMLESLKDYEVA